LLDDCSHMLGILHSSLMDSDHRCSIIVRDEFMKDDNVKRNNKH
jgi:hypothetical protein